MVDAAVAAGASVVAAAAADDDANWSTPCGGRRRIQTTTLRTFQPIVNDNEVCGHVERFL